LQTPNPGTVGSAQKQLTDAMIESLSHVHFQFLPSGGWTTPGRLSAKQSSTEAILQGSDSRNAAAVALPCE